MQALRKRFQPAGDPNQASESNRSPPMSSRDYFTHVPASPTVRAPSLPSTTPRNAMTPSAGLGQFHGGMNGFTKVDAESTDSIPEVVPITTRMVSPDSTARHSSKVARRASAQRKQVAAGDLAMANSTASSENGGVYYRPAAPTPGLPRMDTWRGRLSGSATDVRHHNGMPIASSSEANEDNYEVREAVLMCIAKSIGLAQPSEGNLDSLGRTSASMAPSVSAASTPNSPMFPTGGRNTSRSPFGNVLDMMNASTNGDNILGGMLREAAMNRGTDDDMSSVSGSIQESQAGAINDINKNVLSDLEGNVEILYYKKGSVVVKEGERSPGIYYVIDGFLEVCLQMIVS